MNSIDLLSLFGLQGSEVPVFEKLLQHGPQKAGELAKRTSLNRTSIYDLLDRLTQVGLVYETMRGEVKFFATQSPEKIKYLIEEKEKGLAKAKRSLSTLQVLYKNSLLTPRFRMFEGQQELQQMMKDALLYNDITVYAYWPVSKVVEVLGPDFQKEFHTKRVQNNISLRTIWPYKSIPSLKSYPFLEPGTKYKRDLRIAPKTADFSLGYAIYGNTVRFISSSQENFGFLIESSELTQMMKSQFELVWRLSKPFKK